MKKTIICLIGPSGSGKTYIGKVLKKMGYKEIISCTTRDKRVGEEDNIDYHFLSLNEFFQTKMVERNLYSGEWYGTSYDEIDKQMKFSDCLYQVTTYSGFEALKNTFPKYKVISVFVSATQETREKRMSLRGDSLASIQYRILTDKDKWIETEEKCDINIDNDSDSNVEKLINHIQTVIKNKLEE